MGCLAAGGDDDDGWLRRGSFFDLDFDLAAAVMLLFWKDDTGAPTVSRVCVSVSKYVCRSNENRKNEPDTKNERVYGATTATTTTTATTATTATAIALSRTDISLPAITTVNYGPQLVRLTERARERPGSFAPARLPVGAPPGRFRTLPPGVAGETDRPTDRPTETGAVRCGSHVLISPSQDPHSPPNPPTPHDDAECVWCERQAGRQAFIHS